MVYAGNRIAMAELTGDTSVLDKVTEADKKTFEAYLAKKIAQVKVENPDVPFLRERILTMYANPLINKLSLKFD
jgi:hypothetical protein